jgi:hypothetical protein
VVDEGDPPPAGGLGDDLVAEHGSAVAGPQLLEVGAAEPAGEHAHDLAGPLGLGQLDELRAPVGV